jgi:hypothetical protein
VGDATFWKDRPSVPKAHALPEGKDAVSIYGYPVGSSSLALLLYDHTKSALR